MELLGFLGLFEMVLLLGFALIFLLFPLFALISVFKNKFIEDRKLLWILIILLVPFLGAFLYFIIEKR